MKLRTKATLSIMSVAIILFVSAIGYVITSSSAKVQDDAEKLTIETLRAAAYNIESGLAADLRNVENTARILSDMDRSHPNIREIVAGLLASGVQSSPRTRDMWLGFQPNAFDGKDEEFKGTEWYGATGQLTLDYMDNGDGTSKRTKNITTELMNLPESDWYQLPLKTGHSLMVDPYLYTYADGSKFIVTSLCAPVRIDGKVVGVAGVDITLGEIQEIIKQVKVVSPRSVIQLVTDKGTFVAATNSENNGKNFFDTLKKGPETDRIVDAIRKGTLYTFYEYLEDFKGDAMKIFFPIRFGGLQSSLSICAYVPVDDMLADTNRMTRNSILVSVLGLLLLTLLIVWIVHSIVKPIAAVSKMMRRGAGLDFTVDPADDWLSKSKDETGMMARDYASLRESLTGVFHDLQREAESFSSSAQTLAAISQESVASMEEVRASVEEVARLSSSNSTALEGTSGAVDEVSRSASSTAASVEEAAKSASLTADLSQEAASEVHQVVGQMEEVATRSKKSGESIQKVNNSVEAITSFVSVITGIADQTNLLALNAAIEAARAGDAGRGFAVVAEEVRKLAEESGNAAQEVHKLISDLQSDTDNASRIIHEVERILEKTVERAGEAQEKLSREQKEIDSMNGSMQTIAAGAEEQAAASNELANSTNQIVRATGEVVNTLEDIKSATRETASAGENVAQEAQNLSVGVEKIRNILAMFRYDSKKTETRNALKGGTR